MTNQKDIIWKERMSSTSCVNEFKVFHHRAPWFLSPERRKIKKRKKREKESWKRLRAWKEKRRERSMFKLFTAGNVVIKPGDTRLGKGIVFSPEGGGLAPWTVPPSRRAAPSETFSSNLSRNALGRAPTLCCEPVRRSKSLKPGSPKPACSVLCPQLLNRPNVLAPVCLRFHFRRVTSSERMKSWRVFISFKSRQNPLYEN